MRFQIPIQRKELSQFQCQTLGSVQANVQLFLLSSVYYIVFDSENTFLTFCRSALPSWRLIVTVKARVLIHITNQERCKGPLFSLVFIKRASTLKILPFVCRISATHSVIILQMYIAHFSLNASLDISGFMTYFRYYCHVCVNRSSEQDTRYYAVK